MTMVIIGIMFILFWAYLIKSYLDYWFIQDNKNLLNEALLRWNLEICFIDQPFSDGGGRLSARLFIKDINRKEKPIYCLHPIIFRFLLDKVLLNNNAYTIILNSKFKQYSNAYKQLSKEEKLKLKYLQRVK